MRKPTPLLVLLLALALAGCSAGGEPETPKLPANTAPALPGSELPLGVAAKVGPVTIASKQVDLKVEQALAQAKSAPAGMKIPSAQALRSSFTNELVRAGLVRLEAKRLGLAPSDGTKLVAKMAKQFPSAKAWRANLKRMATSEQRFALELAANDLYGRVALKLTPSPQVSAAELAAARKSVPAGVRMSDAMLRERLTMELRMRTLDARLLELQSTLKTSIAPAYQPEFATPPAVAPGTVPPSVTTVQP